jgi:hypothetical protein
MKVRRTIILTVLLATQGLVVFGQKQVEERNQTWFAYFNQTRFTEKSGLWVDLHYRLNDDFIKEKAIVISRVGYTYFLSDQVRLTAGYGFVRHFSHVPTNPDISEHRPWQQIQWLEKKKWFSMSQYLRVEQRYRPTVVNGEATSNYNFNWRFRYNFAITLPLKGNSVEANEPFLFLNDEVHINAGKRIGINYFDQNRFFAGFGYQFTAKLNAQLGYLYVFQQQPTPNQFVHINAIRLFVFHNLDLRIKE